MRTLRKPQGVQKHQTIPLRSLSQNQRRYPNANHYLITCRDMKKLRPYLDHGFLELDNNAVERSMRPIALGRRNYLFMGSERGGKSAAIAYILIETAKLNNVDPQAWLTDVLSRITDHKSIVLMNSCPGITL